MRQLHWFSAGVALSCLALTIYGASGGHAEVLAEDRELVRAKFEAALDADWPGYVTRELAGVQPAA